MLEFLNGKEKEQNKIIEKLCQESEEAALLIMSEIGDVNRFATGTKFCGYCGLRW
jgi:hypothetical protein